MIVIDASSLSAYILREEGFERFVEHLRKGAASIELVVKETANAMLSAEMRRRISEREAEVALRALEILAEGVIRMFEQRDLLVPSYSISRSQSITIYDAIYIALAKKLRVKLLTRDERQAEAAENLGVGTVRE